MPQFLTFYIQLRILTLFLCDFSSFLVGNLRSLNELAKKANADHIIHTGDFGFYDNSSLERIADKSVLSLQPKICRH